MFVILSTLHETVFSGAHFEPMATHFNNYPFLLWLGVLSNLAIALAYLSIPVGLIFFVKKRNDVGFNWLVILFSAFIFSCGLHHIVHVFTYWWPLYGIQGVVDFITASVSLLTAGLLWHVLPYAIRHIPNVNDMINMNQVLERKVQERTQELEEAKEKLQFRGTLLKNMTDAIYTIDSNLRIIYWNKGAEELYGYTEREVLGKLALDVVTICFDQPTHEEIWQTVHKDGKWCGEMLQYGKDKTKPLYVLSSFSTVHTNRKQQNGYVIVNRDITERRRLEQMKDDFIGVASHELKTPITSLKIYTQLLERYSQSAKDAQASRHLQKMSQQIDRLTNIISDLLDTTRIYAKKLELNLERIYLCDVVQSVTEDIQAAVTSHTIELQMCGGSLVKADAHRIGQVVINLINNAVRYSPEADKIIVTVRKTHTDTVCSVQDFGVGIPEADLPHIFERFYRVSNNKTQASTGLGLGLYIVAGIIKQHGGKVWVNSEVNKGSTFFFSLPLT